jgi:hypothetical protein
MGYQAQSMSLLASVYELVSTMHHIGSDFIKAQNWLDHEMIKGGRAIKESFISKKIEEVRKEWLAENGLTDPKEATKEYDSVHCKLSSDTFIVTFEFGSSGMD